MKKPFEPLRGRDMRLVSKWLDLLKLNFVGHLQAITPSKGQRFLNSISHCYTLGSIVKSELRILQTLDYHILITTPLTFLETILEILGHNDPQAQVKLLHDASVKVLDIVYLKFEEIYTKLCMVATGENYCTKEGRQSLSVLTSDLMLLAVSVIGAASYIVNKATSDMVTDDIIVTIQTIITQEAQMLFSVI